LNESCESCTSAVSVPWLIHIRALWVWHDSFKVSMVEVSLIDDRSEFETWQRVCAHASCHKYEWVMSHIRMSQVTNMDESCHTYDWVMSHILIQSCNKNKSPAAKGLLDRRALRVCTHASFHKY